MSDDNDDPPEERSQKPGRRKDGQPYKEDNTREDGSYREGKYRPPEHGKFRVGDGRQRGKRERGSNNVSNIWKRELSHKRTIGGETKTSAEWLVEAMIRRGITRSDRAAEKSLSEAERIERALERSSNGQDDDLMVAYFEQRLLEMAQQVLDDHDGEPAPNEESAPSDNHDNQNDGEGDDAHP